MTLYTVVEELKKIALRQPGVRSAYEGSVYDVMNTNPKQRYTVFHISQLSHRQTKEFNIYSFNLFYIDRLDDSLENNRLQVQSIGKEVLANIIKTFCEYHDADYNTIVFHPFTEKFTDLTAGMYATVEFEIPLDYLCEEDY